MSDTCIVVNYHSWAAESWPQLQKSLTIFSTLNVDISPNKKVHLLLHEIIPLRNFNFEKSAIKVL